MLRISNLKASVDGKEILRGVNIAVGHGELHVLMGPNGSGKSTLAQVIAGHPSYTIDSGQLTFDPSTSSGQAIDIRKLSPDKRAKLGIFLGFQHPMEVPGVSVFNVLRKAVSGPVSGFPPASARSRQKSKVKGKSNSELRAVGILSTAATRNVSRFREQLLEHASSLKLSDDFLRRSLNEGFSGGEKKRSEILQMMALKPRLAILDEIDSGLDVDGLKLIAKAIKQFTVNSPQSSVILITHYARILKYLKPDFVHVMVEGRIVRSGDSRLADAVERSGYTKLVKKNKNLKIKDQNYNSKFKNNKQGGEDRWRENPQ